MLTLIYKRTHKGDPDERGIFGINDCMGQVRDRDYDAVIGVGGVSAEGDIKYKVNWIGIGPRKGPTPAKYRAPQITFDHFIYFDEKGPDLRDFAPALAQHIYTSGRAPISSFTETEQAEVDRILKMAEEEPPSRGWSDLCFDSLPPARGEGCPEPCNDKKRRDIAGACVPHGQGKCVKNRKNLPRQLPRVCGRRGV